MGMKVPIYLCTWVWNPGERLPNRINGLLHACVVQKIS
jgi:hypothetical protein